MPRLLPAPEITIPDDRSVGRYLLSLLRAQGRSVAIGALLGIVWMTSLALLPWAIGHGVDAMNRRDRGGVVEWSVVLLGLGALVAVSGGLRHWAAVTNWLYAAFRSAGQTHEHLLRAGPAITRAVPTGEVVAVFTTDVMRIGNLYDVTARFTGAVASYVVVGVILLRTNLEIGLLVLLGAPVVLGALTLLVRPLQRRQATQREEAGRLTTLGADTVAGLRVLRGIGGEETFLRRYEAQSRTVRGAGWRVAGLQAALDSTQVLVPATFAVLVTWVGARAVVRGDLTPGQLVSFFGYASFLAIPLTTVIEFIDRFVRARIAAGKVLRVLHITPDHVDAGTARAAGTSGPVELHDLTSDLRIRRGRLTAIVSAVPEESAAIIDRLGRIVPDGSGTVCLDGVPLEDLPLEHVRRHVVVSESDPRLFAGPLREQLGGAPEEVRAALAAASAEDAVDALPNGLDGELEERARSLSGGQRQRLALTRALLTEAPVLALIEPTSAVDAHTEARIATRLADHRRGRTTVIATASPLVLDTADTVVFVAGGRVVDEGPHAELLHRSAAYRAVVVRGGEN